MRKFELVVLLSGLLVSACSTGESNTQSIRRTLDELDRGDEAVRAKAALALGTPRVFNADRTTVQAVVKALIKGLSDESAHVRAASAASLGQFGSFAKLGSRSKETVRSLAQGLRDPSEDVRCTAA